MNKNIDIKIGHCLNSYKDIGYNWEVIELENENSSRVYFSKEDEKLIDENLKKKEFLERLEELKMPFQKFLVQTSTLLLRLQTLISNH